MPKQTEKKTEVTSHDKIEVLLKKNIQWTQAVYEQNKVIKRRLLFTVILGYVKIVLILIPIVIGFIFLPPYFQEFFGQVTSILDGFGEFTSLPVNDLFKQIPQK
jgi:hypothetical protein